LSSKNVQRRIEQTIRTPDVVFRCRASHHQPPPIKPWWDINNNKVWMSFSSETQSLNLGDFDYRAATRAERR
jgi:hypothetical protein